MHQPSFDKPLQKHDLDSKIEPCEKHPQGAIAKICTVYSYADALAAEGVGSHITVTQQTSRDWDTILSLPCFHLRQSNGSAADQAQKAAFKNFVWYLQGQGQQDKVRAAKAIIKKTGHKGYIIANPEGPGLRVHFEPLGAAIHPAHAQPPQQPQEAVSSDPFAETPGDATSDPFAVTDDAGTWSETGAAASVDPFSPSMPDGGEAPPVAEAAELPSTFLQARGPSDQERAADHYNTLKRSRESQADSYIYHVKRFNNWVKSALIQRAKPEEGRKGIRVLDLACGKGGDLAKWGTHKVSKYVGVDIAKVSLEDLVKRLHERNPFPKAQVKLVAGDLGAMDLADDYSLDVWDKESFLWGKGRGLEPSDVFDVCSMQFALHYMGETEEKLKSFMSTVGKRLRPGGIFVATTPDARVLMELLMGHTRLSASGTELEARIDDETGRNLLRVAFEKDAKNKYLKKDMAGEDQCSPYGIRYVYQLKEEAQGQNAVDAPEWMLPLPQLEEAARAAGMTVRTALNFHDFYRAEMATQQGMDLMRRLGVFNRYGTMNAAEWAVARIYLALVLEKQGDGPNGAVAPAVPRSPEGPPPESMPIKRPRTPNYPPPFSPQRRAAAGHKRPRTPDHPPPGFTFPTAPHSPTGPPPPQHQQHQQHEPHSPPGQPPPQQLHAPSSPPGPPPPFGVPRSPPGPPPPGEPWAPRSPGGPPPDGYSDPFSTGGGGEGEMSDSSSDDEDFAAITARAQALNNTGRDWNDLLPEEKNRFMAAAREETS
ncbi:unnamed protein product [Chrysoparadoxa australica]